MGGAGYFCLSRPKRFRFPRRDNYLVPYPLAVENNGKPEAKGITDGIRKDRNSRAIFLTKMKNVPVLSSL
jgi:hypothetical protein